MAKKTNALDLNELLQHDMGTKGLLPVFDLIAQHSWWVSQKVYHEIQTIYPKTRRKKGTAEKRGISIDGIRLWDNQPASHAFWMALGRDPKAVRNSYVCHIYEGSVWNPNHFTNLANLTVFPASLQSLSEWVPIRELLKYHSFATYQYTGPCAITPVKPEYYPLVWRHQHDPSWNEIERIVNKLKAQRDRRPGFISVKGGTSQ